MALAVAAKQVMRQMSTAQTSAPFDFWGQAGDEKGNIPLRERSGGRYKGAGMFPLGPSDAELRKVRLKHRLKRATRHRLAL